MSPYYKDNFIKIRNHSFLLSLMCCCYYMLFMHSGSMILRNSGEIRQLCNGLIEIAEQEIEKEIFKRKNSNIGGCEKCC